MRVFDHDFPDNLPDEWCTALRKFETERELVRVNGCLFVVDHRPNSVDGVLWYRTTIPFGDDGRCITLSRLICAALHGLDIDDRSLVARHRCDNGHCIQPTHLEPGTRQEDAADKSMGPRVDDAAPASFGRFLRGSE